MPTCREGPIGLGLTIPSSGTYTSKLCRAVEPHLPKSVRFLICTFGEWKNGKVIEKGAMCKMTRGQMVRWLAENGGTSRADIRAFDQLGHRSQPELSDENHDVFLKSGTEK